MLLGTMLLTSCGKTDYPDQTPNATEQTSEEIRQTTDERSKTAVQNPPNSPTARASSSQPQTSVAST